MTPSSSRTAAAAEPERGRLAQPAARGRGGPREAR